MGMAPGATDSTAAAAAAAAAAAEVAAGLGHVSSTAVRQSGLSSTSRHSVTAPGGGPMAAGFRHTSDLRVGVLEVRGGRGVRLGRRGCLPAVAGSVAGAAGTETGHRDSRNQGGCWGRSDFGQACCAHPRTPRRLVRPTAATPLNHHTALRPSLPPLATPAPATRSRVAGQVVLGHPAERLPLFRPGLLQPLVTLPAASACFRRRASPPRSPCSTTTSCWAAWARAPTAPSSSATTCSTTRSTPSRWAGGRLAACNGAGAGCGRAARLSAAACWTTRCLRPQGPRFFPSGLGAGVQGLRSAAPWAVWRLSGRHSPPARLLPPTPPHSSAPAQVLQRAQLKRQLGPRPGAGGADAIDMLRREVRWARRRGGGLWGRPQAWVGRRRAVRWTARHAVRGCPG